MRGKFRTHFDRTPGSKSIGKLLVDVEGYENQPLPIEVRDEDLRLLGMAMTEQTLTLSPGQYAISLLLPDGDNKVSLVDVLDGGDRQSLTMSAKPAIDESTDWSQYTYGSTDEYRPQGWFARLVTYREGRWVRSEHALVTRKNVQRYVEGSIVSEMEVVGGFEQGIYFLELVNVSPAGGVESVALPLARNTEAERCRLVITDTGASVSVEVSLLGYGGIQAVSDYMQNGALQEAAALMSEAEDMLYGKISNPIAAALGGYALLRQGEIERLHNWPTNLASWFEWLPDGAVISAELMARRGDHPSAADFLLLAVKRGLPLFSEGMSILMSRLRYYSLYAKDQLGQGYSAQHIEEGLATVQKWATAVDLSNLMLVLKDVSLTGESLSLETISADNNGRWSLFGQPAPQIMQEVHPHSNEKKDNLSGES